MQLNWNDIVDLVVVSACGPPGGGRNFVTARYYRHFSMVIILQKKLASFLDKTECMLYIQSVCLFLDKTECMYNIHSVLSQTIL